MSDLDSDYTLDSLALLNQEICEECQEAWDKRDMQDYRYPDGTVYRYCRQCCQMEDEAMQATCDFCLKDWPIRWLEERSAPAQPALGDEDTDNLISLICRSCVDAQRKDHDQKFPEISR